MADHVVLITAIVLFAIALLFLVIGVPLIVLMTNMNQVFPGPRHRVTGYDEDPERHPPPTPEQIRAIRRGRRISDP
jgi:hypothetical protein